MPDVHETFSSCCKELLANLPDGLSWQWDAHMSAALVVFASEVETGVVSALEQAFAQSWDSSSIASAPQPIQDLAASMRGIAAGQRLYALLLGGSAVLYGAWWPWGSGTTISLRVALRGDDQGSQWLHEWFGLQDN